MNIDGVSAELFQFFIRLTTWALLAIHLLGLWALRPYLRLQQGAYLGFILISSQLSVSILIYTLVGNVGYVETGILLLYLVLMSLVVFRWTK